jgi:hypothetical protein
MKKVKNPWSFAAPEYHKRSGNAVNAGTHYGVGKTQPVGSEKHTAKGGVPFGHKHGKKVDDLG